MEVVFVVEVDEVRAVGAVGCCGVFCGEVQNVKLRCVDGSGIWRGFCLLLFVIERRKQARASYWLSLRASSLHGREASQGPAIFSCETAGP